ncbi:MAG: 2-hydroxyacyl-CoA dehydratase [Oscillospiraceae bacterium]|jgi:predicted nucleotide-binding protein (sugar kinase/HSP70/actin superfamily)|nr:2-hydroxyacyl-CoA dehydratase [Oscillospiraceae bacterium]
MAKLIYDETGRLLFTEEMKKEYTLLMPQMLPVHFSMMQRCLELHGYQVDMLTTNHRAIVDTGLKYVHNDTCYPALLVIGQLIEAVQSGKYDPHKVGLLITQTGGGCRASNYIHLLRKALARAGLEYIPVVSVNLSGLDKNPGFRLSLSLIRQLIFSMMYGDLIVQIANQCRPYEVDPGATDALIETWINRLVSGFEAGKGLKFSAMVQNFDAIAADFKALPQAGEPKIRVGVVGEIYIKYAPLGNNNLEAFLLSEGAEPVVPGLTDFIIFKIYNRDVDVDLYGGKWIKQKVVRIFKRYVEKCQHAMIAAIERSGFRAPEPFESLHQRVKGYLGDGNKMGEGWLLTAEMLELIHSGTNNIVCTQPFGCLPNHVVGKGMIRRLKDDYPTSNIVAIDYDPGATKINQENRIKLMLANAKRNPGHFAPAAPVETVPQKKSVAV